MAQDREYIPVDPSLLQAIDARSSWSDVVGVGNTLWVTGQLGWDRHTGEFREGIEAQTEQALENLKQALERAGSSLRDVVSVHVYLTEQGHYHAYEPVYQRYFPENPPARVSLVVAELIHHALIDIEAIAVRRSGAG